LYTAAVEEFEHQFCIILNSLLKTGIRNKIKKQ
jgi:hypothetical protein